MCVYIFIFFCTEESLLVGRCLFCVFFLLLPATLVCERCKHIDVYCAVLPNTKKLSLPNKVFLMCHRRKDRWTIVSSAKEDFFFISDSFHFFIYIIFNFFLSALSHSFLNMYISAHMYIDSFGNFFEFLVHRAIYIAMKNTHNISFHTLYWIDIIVAIWIVCNWFGTRRKRFAYAIAQTFTSLSFECH